MLSPADVKASQLIHIDPSLIQHHVNKGYDIITE